MLCQVVLLELVLSVFVYLLAHLWVVQFEYDFFFCIFIHLLLLLFSYAAIVLCFLNVNVSY